MKKLILLPFAAAFALVVSCEKPQSEADKSAQIEREVQQRLAAERQADDQQRLAQQQVELTAREKALADKEAAAKVNKAAPIAPPRTVRRTEDLSDSRPRVASSDREAPRSYDTFYRKLEPFGAWRETGDYGYVWQPRQAQQSRDWRPYTNGRWAYTDAGWTWVSEEPFGWATYHYGRWTRLRNVGWVWVPGEEWAPAWVSWRKGDRNVGWAPLPPEARFERNTGIKKWADSYYDISADEYVFIPNEDIGSERLERDIIPTERNITIVNETTNVTNITYNNTTIINEGPNFDELSGHSRRPLERMRLEREYNVQQDANPQAVVRGTILSMVTPMFTAQAVERPRNVGEPIRQVQVERNWTNNANQPEAERARAKLKSESTPPPNAPPKRFEKPAVLASAPSNSPAANVPAATPQASASASAATPVPTATVAATASSTPTASVPRPSAPPTATPEATATPINRGTPVPPPTATAAPAAEVGSAPASPAKTEAELKRDAAVRAKVQAIEQRHAADMERKTRDAEERQRRLEATSKAAPSVAPSPEDAAATTLPVVRSTPPKPVMTPRALPTATASAVEETTLVIPKPVPAATATPALPTPTPTPTATPVEIASNPAPPAPAESKKEKKDKKNRRAMQPGEPVEAEPAESPEGTSEP